MPVDLLIAFVVLTIGNAELLVTVVNRLHSQPLSRRLLKWSRVVHDLLIVLFPIWLIVGVWWPSQKLLSPPLTIETIWSAVPFGVRLYFVLCGLGCLGFVRSVLRYQFYRAPRQQIGYASRVIDIAAELGSSPIGPGPMQSALRIPGNECFQVDFTERTLSLPGLPRELDGLRILHLSDLHYLGTVDLPYFERLCDHIQGMSFDLAVFTGDLMDDMNLMSWIAKTLGRIRAPLGQYSILGNHDWLLEPATIRDSLAQAGWTNVGSCVEIITHRGASIAIAGNERPWMGSAPSLQNVSATAFRLALVHSPDNINWARQQGVQLMLSGHNHGGHIVLPVIGPVYSPSLYGCAFSAGLFWRDPTLLCVSRGISGRHPLRLRCRPEIGVLELRSEDAASGHTRSS